MKKWTTLLAVCLCACRLAAQESFPVNGVSDKREECYAFTNATVVKDDQTILQHATLVIRKGKIVSVAPNAVVPADAVVVDCKDKYIYPSFIDAYSDYGIGIPQAERGVSIPGQRVTQFNSAQKGPWGWNQAIRSDVVGSQLFAVDENKAKLLRETGFGTVLSHQKDGIARGTGVVVTLADSRENLVIIKDKASAHYSFNKGVSSQSYPSSLMGSIALLRQTYLDAQWYKGHPATEGVNLSLQYWNEAQQLPQIFEANDKWNAVRADRIGDEFGIQYIIKAGGDEYQRIKEMKATNAAFILPVNFPQAMDVEDPNDARFVSLEDMKHWEMAPAQPGIFEKAGISFCFTSADLKDGKQFLANIRKAIENGLSEQKALQALTKTPASLLGVYDKVGSLEPGKLASFIITSGPVFKENTVVYQNWVQGKGYDVKNENRNAFAGNYSVTVTDASGGQKNYLLNVKNETSASIIAADTIPARFSFNGKLVRLSFSDNKKSKAGIRLSGVSYDNTWQGNGLDSAGNTIFWTASYTGAAAKKGDSARAKSKAVATAVNFPFNGYGWEQLPVQQTLLIKNATVWTNEKEGKLATADVLVKNGKIAGVGKGLSDAAATVIDGTGKHLTAGIIDEHSHIATASINEGAQSVTAEVRIADNLNPDDINIYRQLSGGVTTSHILHGSANTIGGQTQLIKLRWGVNDEELKFKGADPFIKFALGENVKRTTSTANNRFPDTRMGVEQVMIDAFERATAYQTLKGSGTGAVRRDLELEALSEILNKKRFITCHSYVQSEITSTIRVAERFGFTLNTFTHILEGYKVADKIKAHGANVSTFSDWWAYKMEVQDAIAYNAAIMSKLGLNVCINSDDAEMARRLNQEAAKAIRYGGVSEEDALKMVTLNPAIALHVADKVGSIKVGKDADLVLWSDHPLSIYAKAEKTIVDGTVYFDRARDIELRKKIKEERNRLTLKMLAEKKNGASMAPARPSFNYLLSCGDHEHHDGLITLDGDDEQ